MTKIDQLLRLVEDGEGPGVNAMGTTPTPTVGFRKKRFRFKKKITEASDLERVERQFADLTSLSLGAFRAIYNDQKQIELRYENINGPKIGSAVITPDGEPKIDVDLTELLTFLINKHDITYEYSDGYSYRAGQDSLNTIKRLAAKINPETVVQIWNDNVDKKIKTDKEEYYWKNI